MVFNRDVKYGEDIFLSGHVIDIYSHEVDFSEGSYRRNIIKFSIKGKVYYMRSGIFVDSTCTLSEYMHYKLGKLV